MQILEIRYGNFGCDNYKELFIEIKKKLYINF